MYIIVLHNVLSVKKKKKHYYNTGSIREFIFYNIVLNTLSSVRSIRI